jgi:GntR family transcriptional regulator
VKTSELVRIDDRSPLPVYAQIEAQLTMLIAAGHFAPGERIPSVRELAVALRINPLTVSKAYGRLADRDLVITRRGKGVFVPIGEKALSQEKKEDMVLEKADCLLREAELLGISPKRVLELMASRMKKGENRE